jgi:hypothetical protein
VCHSLDSFLEHRKEAFHSHTAIMPACAHRRPSDAAREKKESALSHKMAHQESAVTGTGSISTKDESSALKTKKKDHRSTKRVQFTEFSDDIFNHICANISVRDVVSLSMTCHTVKEKVEPLIYKHMRILDIDHIDDEDELIIQQHFGNFKDESLESESWWVHNNISNIKSAKNILYLVYNILVHPEHGKYLKSIEINTILKPSPWKRLKDDESNVEHSIWNQTLDNFLDPEELQFMKIKFPFFNSSLTLFDCILLLLDYTPNLESLIVARFSLPNVSKMLLKTHNLKELKIMIYENDDFTDLPLQKLGKLEKLRIKFQENTESSLEKLALSFNKCNVLSNLKSLHLKYDKTDFNHLTKPTWFSFFKPLLCSNEQPVFKALKTLELKHCFFDNTQKELVDQLATLIPFAQIESLSLQVYEYSHKGRKHSECVVDNAFDPNNTIISHLSPLLKNLKTIVLKPTKNCKGCQILSVINFLQSHRHITDMWISTDTLNKETYIKMMNILTNYKELEKLAYFDEFINLKLLNNMRNWFIYEHKILDFDIFKNYEVETLRQDIDPLFDCYIIDEFKNFNERERDLLVLFWQNFLRQFALINLMNRDNNSMKELKLFGYNFKVDRHRRVILFYVSKVVGYVDLLYY